MRWPVWTAVVAVAAACSCPTDLQQTNCKSAKLVYECQRQCLLAGDASEQCTTALGCCVYVKELVPLYAELDISCSNGFECGDGSLATWIFITISVAAGLALVGVGVVVWKCCRSEPPPPAK
jgi:hypothetical protein